MISLTGCGMDEEGIIIVVSVSNRKLRFRLTDFGVLKDGQESQAMAHASPPPAMQSADHGPCGSLSHSDMEGETELWSPSQINQNAMSGDSTVHEHSTALMPVVRHDLLDGFYNYIMSDDQELSLEKEWIVSSKPYPIRLTLKQIQESLQIDQPLGTECFNMAVRKLAFNEIPIFNGFESAVIKHFLDLRFCKWCDFGRHPLWRKDVDVTTFARSIDRWPWIDYGLASSKMFLMPFMFLDHFRLFVIGMEERTVYIFDSIPLSNMFRDNPTAKYAMKIAHLTKHLNRALEVVIPGWSEDLSRWVHKIPADVPKDNTRELTGFLVFNIMRTWNGERLEPPICTDGYEPKKKFMVHLLNFQDNEAKHNIPEVVHEYLRLKWYKLNRDQVLQNVRVIITYVKKSVL